MRASDDPSGLIGDLIRKGTIDSVDLGSARATVRCGDIVSPPIAWLELAGATRSWFPPSVGEQVVLLCPEGDISGSIFLRGLSSNRFPALGDGKRCLIEFEDGAVIAYDPEAHHLDIILPAGATGTIEADGGLRIKGDIELDGKLTASDDVLAGSISLKNHKHGGVQAGTAQSGAPA